MSTRQRVAGGLRQVSEMAFGLLIFLELSTPSWRYGPFSWLPLWNFRELAGAPMEIGVFNLLPLVAVAGAALARLLDRRPWRWGPTALVLPLLGLTLVGFAHLDPGNFRLVFIHAGMFGLAWFVYLMIINERPRLVAWLALTLAVQGIVAIGQFLAQRDLGLVVLGELPLHPAFEGNSVLWARGQPWLRAYGLTAHPNLLGGMLAALLLLVLPALATTQGWPRRGLIAAIALGAAGLFLSFSRGSWLGLAAGLAAWWLFNQLVRPKTPELGRSRNPRRWQWLLALVPVALLLFLYRDLVFSRFFALDTPIEARSIGERLRDMTLALQVIRHAPLAGVGLGYYVDVARQLDPNAALVHNVGLLVFAELGLPGFIFWLWLMLGPFWLLLRGRRAAEPGGRDFYFAHAGAQLGPWVAMLVINSVDTMLWLSSNWQTSILFALLLANLVRPVAAQPVKQSARAGAAQPLSNMSSTSATRS